MKKILAVVMLANLILIGAALRVGASVQLTADQWKVIGTNEQGTTSQLYCAPESGVSHPLYCQDNNKHDPRTVTGTRWHRAPTRYGWEYKGTPATIDCIPDSSHPERFKTLLCEFR